MRGQSLKPSDSLNTVPHDGLKPCYCTTDIKILVYPVVRADLLKR